MTVKKKVTEKGVLNGEIEKLMTPEAIKELGSLTPTMQQFLLRWQEHRDMILGDQIKEEMKDFLLDIYEADNEKICKNIAEIVTAQNKRMFDALTMQTTMISDIASNISLIKMDINDIRKRLTVLEVKLADDELKIATIDEQLKSKGERINTLECQMRVLNPDLIKQFVDEMILFKPCLDKLMKYSSFWATSGRMTIAIIIGITIMTALLKFVFYVI